MTSPFRLLATSYDYRPRLGGVATCAYELLKAMSGFPCVQIRLLANQQAGADVFDQHSVFETKRLALPSNATKAVVPITRNLVHEIRSWKPQAILNMLWLPDGVASFLCAPVRRFYSTPYFVFAHAVELLESTHIPRKQVRKFFSPVKRAVFQNTTKAFAVSRFTGSLLESECRLDAEKIRVVYNGVDPESFYPTAPVQDLVLRYGLQGKKVFLTVTRLIDYKGVDRFIAALRFIVRKHPDVIYLVCGIGPDLKRLESLAHHYRVAQHVIFTGAVPFDRLRDFYNLCDCFVLLSREDYESPNVEGFGLVYLEAAACGKASIGGRSGGIPDAVRNGETGWLVDPWDDKAIAQVVMEILDAPDCLAERGQKALQWARNHRTWKIMAQLVLEEMRQYVRN